MNYSEKSKCSRNLFRFKTLKVSQWVTLCYIFFNKKKGAGTVQSGRNLKEKKNNDDDDGGDDGHGDGPHGKAHLTGPLDGVAVLLQGIREPVTQTPVH